MLFTKKWALLDVMLILFSCEAFVVCLQSKLSLLSETDTVHQQSVQCTDEAFKQQESFIDYCLHKLQEFERG